MPELPEVETIVRELSSLLNGKKIQEAKVFWERSIATPDAKTLCLQLRNQFILNVSRRGKYIIFTLSNFTLLVHLRMTGKFTLSGSKKPSIHERVQLSLDNGEILHFSDQRKFGKWYLLTHPEAKLGELGLEPFSKEFTLKTFEKLLQKSSVQIKPFLLNQHHIVGLGNIYADEALWEAKIAPMRKVNTLAHSEIVALYHAIPHVLEAGIANMGTSLGSKNSNYFSVSRRPGLHQKHLKVFRRHGMLCPRCQNKIIRIIVAQRGTHYCPNCQR